MTAHTGGNRLLGTDVMITAAAVLQLLILAGALYDTARLQASPGGRRPVYVRLRRHRAALEAAERRLVRQRLRGGLDAAVYRERMRAIADGRRPRAGRRRR